MGFNCSNIGRILSTPSTYFCVLILKYKGPVQNDCPTGNFGRPLSSAATLRHQSHDVSYPTMYLPSFHLLMSTYLVRMCVGISVTPSATTPNFVMGIGPAGTRRQHSWERNPTTYNAAFRGRRETAGVPIPQLCSVRPITDLQILLPCCSARQPLGQARRQSKLTPWACKIEIVCCG